MQKAVNAGRAKRKAQGREWECAREQNVFADRCTEEKAERELGRRQGRDSVEVKNARGTRGADGRANLTGAHHDQDHGLKSQEHSERPA